MHIYFNGDSNMAGAEIESGKPTIASTISRRLRANKTINHAFTGASNDYIYRTTMEYLQNNTPDFVVIGVTEMGRGEWLVPWYGELQYMQVNNLEMVDDSMIDGSGLRNRYNHWKEFQQTTKPFHESQAWYWHEKYYNLHTMLQWMKIPHIFFHAFHTFRIYSKAYQLDWHGSFVEPYTIGETYIKWCGKNGYKEITPGQHHYDSDAQRAWADRLLSHATREGIL